MKIPRRPPNDLIALCLDRAGLRKGVGLAEFIVEWEVAVRETGGPLTAETFNEWWREGSRRTVYRRLAEFREAFPEFGPSGHPHDLMAPLLEQLARGDADHA